MTNIDPRIIEHKIQQNKETIIDKKNFFFGNIFLLNLASDIPVLTDILKNYEDTNKLKIDDKTIQNNKKFNDLLVKKEICINEIQTNNILINQENNSFTKKILNLQQPIST